MKINKKMKFIEVMGVFPGVSKIFKEEGITNVKPFDTLEEIVRENGGDINHIITRINYALEESKKPININPEEVLDVTPKAVEAFKKLLKDKGLKGYQIRVIVHSPSPNIYSYALDFEKNPKKNDLILERYGLKFFFSKTHANMLGVRIEFDQKENGFKFERLDR